MFTGLIRHKGTVKSLNSKNSSIELEISCPEIIKDKQVGDSIAVDGACLTISELTQDGFKAQVMNETLEKTIIGIYKEGTLTNLESPLKIGDTLDGHMVQGHTDFAGEVKSIGTKGADKEIEISFPPEMAKYFALKGSVTVNGVSLTISYLNTKSYTVSLIPETLTSTNLGSLKKGDKVNIEVDLISRYLDRLLDAKEKTTEYEFLQERGFL